MSSNTIFLVNKDGEHQLKFGPCRCLDQRELDIIVEYLVSEVKNYAPCRVDFIDRYVNDPNPPTAMYYDPKSDNGNDHQPDLMLSKFFEWQKDNICRGNVWSGVNIETLEPSVVHKYEFDDFDLD